MLDIVAYINQFLEMSSTLLPHFKSAVFFHLICVVHDYTCEYKPQGRLDPMCTFQHVHINRIITSNAIHTYVNSSRLRKLFIWEWIEAQLIIPHPHAINFFVIFLKKIRLWYSMIQRHSFYYFINGSNDISTEWSYYVLVLKLCTLEEDITQDLSFYCLVWFLSFLS